MLLHPRTGRLYEVGIVFFYDKLKIAAAYIKVIDGGQADPLDWHPHRIDGKGGLADLVESFEKSGGSSGSSKTPWPTSEEEWLTEQKKDKSGISSANLVLNRQRWVREHPMERRNGPTTVVLPSG